MQNTSFPDYDRLLADEIKRETALLASKVRYARQRGLKVRFVPILPFKRDYGFKAVVEKMIKTEL